jgi:lysophospholipase L1-like esterase
MDSWPLQARYNDILDHTAQALRVPVFTPPIDKFNDGDFVDRGHFSPRGAEKFASMLAPFVGRVCRRRG